ncbi:PREDICTED: uncharacterized protein LOC104810618 [Tarenaya hassleriana]|uniref:uncharacterized protein LOC104810618 n=1 Tax=Tarenaya hassleriana TaxID=28532 RepID=UPI00053C546C|nr:PREDICTED: uncharacterized protein LOC104810618 [Tarenaya hassleriana]
MGVDREERRRRIMERGSDRLAMITGQLHNLDPSSPSSSSWASHQRAYSESFMPQMSSDDHLTPEILAPSYQIQEEKTAREEAKLSSSRPFPRKPAKPAEPTRPETRQRPRTGFFSSKKLNSSIINSERTRSLSSLIIASLVVLLPRLRIVSSDSISAMRPLYVLLLTDCAIVLNHLLMEGSKGSGRETGEGGEDGSGSGGGETWEGAEKLLERSLVVYQAFRGVFIDCSLYMVVVICGLSIL